MSAQVAQVVASLPAPQAGARVSAPAARISLRFAGWMTLTALLAQVCYALSAEKPGFILLGVCASAVSMVLVARRLSGAGRGVLSRAVINALVLGAVLHLVLRFVINDSDAVITKLSDFLSLVMLIKMLDRARVRDEAQLLGLAMFVTIGALLSGQSLGLGLAMMALTPLAIGAAVLLQLHGARERQAELGASVGLGEHASRTADDFVRLRTERRAWSTALVCTLLAGAAAVVVFLLAPRQIAQQLGGALPGQGGGQGSVTGFRDDLRLGETGLISQSGETVMDLEVFDAGGSEIDQLPTPIYLRGAVLAMYDRANGAWRRYDDTEPGLPIGAAPAPSADRGSVSAEDRQGVGRLILGDAGAPGTVLSRLRVTLRSASPGQRSPLFAPMRLVEASSTNRATLRYNVPTGLLSTSWQGGRFAYELSAVTGYAERPVPVWPDVRAETLPPEVVALAREVIKDAGIDQGELVRAGGAGEPVDPALVRRAAQAVSAHLRTRFAYTLQMEAPPLGEMDPLVYFLTVRRAGHCEYFASAMAAMLQSVRVPARVVTGYVAQEFNPVAGHFVVRQSDAHAWVEVLTAPGRWDTFDPTPPGELTVNQRQTRGTLAWLRQAWEAVEFSWLDNVIAYESGIRLDLSRAGTRRSQDGAAEITRAVQRSQEAVRRLLPQSTLGALGVGLVLLAVLVGGAYGLWRLGRWGLPRAWRAAMARLGVKRRSSARALLITEQTRFYGDMLEALRSAGVPKPDASTPLQHASVAVRARSEAAAGAVESLSALYYDARFGLRTLTPDQARHAQDQLALLRRELAPTPRA
jgi:transglutaminase-like putative cysteine protease